MKNLKKLKRSRQILVRSNLVELLERRQLLSATLSVDHSLLVFNAIRNSAASPIETLTLTNTGDAVLTLGAGGVTIVNDPGHSFSGSNDAARFSIPNSVSVPASLNPGQSFGLQLQFSANAVTRNAAILDLQTNDPVNALQQIQLHGIGTAGTGGTNQPSLARILRAYNIPTIVGEGVNDADEAIDSTYPNPPDASSQEVTLQRLVKAGSGPVTIEVLASFTAAGVKPYTLGMYTPGNPNDLHELFYTPTSENQTVFVHPQGSTTFDPGTNPFGLYFVSNVQVQGRIGYSEDMLNPWDTTQPRKFRFFPMKNPDGSPVANAFVMTTTEWNAPVGYDFTNIVAIVRNVMAAPSAPAAPVLGLQDLNALPGSSTMIFNRIQNQNTTLGDQFHDTGTLRINNTGGSNLVINSISLSSAWTLVNAPAFPLTIAAAASFDLTIKFIATSVPSHPYNETNSPSFPNGGGVYNGSITLNSNDPNTPSKIVPLAGWWQQNSENNNEPSLQSLVNLMVGWGTVINPTPGIPELTEGATTATYYGEEEPFGPNRQPVLPVAQPTYWTIADTAAPVSVRQVQSFHTQGSKVPFGWFKQGGGVSTLFTTGADYGQTLFPVKDGTTTPASATFAPGASAFGFRIDTTSGDGYTDDTKNNTSGGGHHTRFYPVRDSSGKLVPNTYILTMDYAVAGSQNFDFQDNVYVVTNIKPSTVLAAPIDLYATAGSGNAALTWAPVPGGVQSYSIYRSLAATSGFSLLTSGLTSTSYVDSSAPAGTTVYYRVSAVNSSALESLGTITSVTTTGTPASALQSIDIAAAPTGSTSVDNTDPTNPHYTVVAGGPGVTGNSDGFRYLFEQQTGDFDVRVQVTGLTVAGNFSTAGLMARTSLNANSANVYMSASPVNYRFKTRATTGATESLTTAGTTSFPSGTWVRLRRAGNVFTGFSSTDGVNWTQVKQMTVALSATVYLGLAVASNNTTATTTAQMNAFGPSFTGPVANADSFNATANLPSSFDVFGNDTDATGTIDKTSVQLSTPSQGGTAVFNPNTGLIDYTPAANFVGTETFTYTVADNNALTSSPATVTIVVAPTGPTGQDDAFTTIAGHAVTVDVVANDTDATGTIDRTTVTIVNQPDHGGTATRDAATGLITYAPAAGFSGTESMTYQVSDSNGLTTQPTVVVFTVTATPSDPIANPDSAATAGGQSVQINVLANDVADTTAGNHLVPTSVTIVAPPDQGGTVQIDPVTGVVTYTPAVDFAGTETFTYTVNDSAGHTSNEGTVTVTVTPNGPVTADDSATAIAGSATVLSVLLNDTSVAAINPASVAVASGPAHGTAQPNANGTITYTPAAGFIGQDSFTYTVADTNGSISNAAVVNVNVGVAVSSARGANHVLSWTDADGTIATLSLNRGDATIFFTNGATLTTTRAGRATISGANSVDQISISGTTAASVLVIRGVGGDRLVTIGELQSTTPLASIIAPAANLTGTMNVGGVSVLQLGSVTSGRITIGNGGSPVGALIIGGAIADTSLTSAVPIRLLRVTSWTDTTGSSSIAAPSIGTLISTGEFNAALNLSGTGSAVPTLGAVQVLGSISGNTWTINGKVNTIIAGSVASAWSGAISGGLNVMLVRTGGFASHLSAASAGVFVALGNLSGATLDVGSLNVLRVTGNVSTSTINVTANANTIFVVGGISGSAITAGGDLGVLVASSLATTTVTAGVDSGVTSISATTPSNIGSHTIRAVRLTSRAAGAFASSTVIAHTITTAFLGDVNTNNAGTTEGLAAVQVSAFVATINGVRVNPTRTQLSDPTQLAAYFSSKGVVLGDFDVDIVT